MTQIKAIETAYAGCKFRSRLEARWAVFFDALPIKWRYEPEGFELPSGARYLPDFYLPQFNVWAEVKPFIPTEGRDHLKIQEFVLSKPDTAILILDDEPSYRLYGLIQAESAAGTWTSWTLLDIHMRPKWTRQGRLGGGYEFSEFNEPEHFTPEYEEAVIRSRSARFGV
ncbi:MAG: hypothetical protein WAN65_17515 [Candidatus Sulfotelmatobacter sp.]